VSLIRLSGFLAPIIRNPNGRFVYANLKGLFSGRFTAPGMNRAMAPGRNGEKER